ncbi:MAG: alpha/beta hydrolase [Gammaproteobacteria bacterium]|nr:alpha/beta hydrolase [Gammaproteobacteria bacterium]
MRNSRLALLASLLLLLTVSGCDRIEDTVLSFMLEPDSVEAVAGVEAINNLIYSETPQGPMLLDVYRPADYTGPPLPVVLFFYGGAFEMGNKHQLALYDVHTLPLDGFAVISIDYRLSDQAIFPAPLEDAANALRWIADNADEYKLDADRIGVWGMSAGGMLAALVGTVGGTDAGAIGKILAAAPRVRAVVDYYGPSDFLQGDDHAPDGVDLNWAAADSWPSRYLGDALANIPQQVAAANPMSYASTDDPPFLIVHGDQDEIVPLHQSELLHAALLDAGVDSELYVVTDGGHARGGEFGSETLHRKTVAFLQEQLQ